MALTKIGDWTNPISSEADRPNRSATDMKAIFDSNTNQIKTAFNTLVDDVEAGDADMTFTEAATRANIASGESMSTILGKVKKFMTDAETAVSTVVVDATYPNRYLSEDGTYTTPTAGEAVNGVAQGGTVGQYYRKKSATDYDGEWATVTPASIGAAAATHASQHGSSGSDPVTPAAIGAIADPDTKSSGQVLKYNGTGWVASAQIELVALWENASPTSSFAGQDVSISTDDYSAFIIEVCVDVDTSSNPSKKSFLCCDKSGESYLLDFSLAQSSIYGSRRYHIETGVCTFAAASKVSGSSRSTDNTLAVPTTIYGIKGLTIS